MTVSAVSRSRSTEPPKARRKAGDIAAIEDAIIDVLEDKHESEKPKAPKLPAVPPPGCEVLMSTAQIAAAMGVSTRQVHLMISSGKFPRCDLRIGRLARWRVSTFNTWLESQCSNPKPKG